MFQVVYFCLHQLIAKHFAMYDYVTNMVLILKFNWIHSIIITFVINDFFYFSCFLTKQLFDNKVSEWLDFKEGFVFLNKLPHRKLQPSLHAINSVLGTMQPRYVERKWNTNVCCRNTICESTSKWGKSLLIFC